MRAVIYGAKSTPDEKHSIPDQIAAARALADRHGWEVVAEYTDENASAYHGNRGPGLAAAMREAEALADQHGEAVIVVWHSNRLARGSGDSPDAARHLAEIIFWARRHRVTLRSVNDPATFEHPILGYVMGEMAHQESAIKSVNVKAGMKRRAQRGLTPGGPRPFGYEWVGGRGEKRLVVVEHEAAIVRRIYAEYIAGRSQRQIVRDLNADGLRTTRGTQWVQGTVSHILASPLYVGKVRMNGEVYDGEHKPIVDAETFEKAKQLRDATARTKGKGRGRKPRAGHLLAGGLLRCGCGSAMGAVTKPTRTPGRLYEVYECEGRKNHGLDYCKQTPVKRAPIDGAVWDFFEQVALDVDATRAALAEQHGSKLAEIAALRSQADRDALRAQDRLSRVRRDYTDGKIDAADWTSFRDELTAELEAAQAQVERLDQQRDEIAQEAEQIDVETALVEELTMVRALVTGDVRSGRVEGVDSFRAALRRLFDHFDLLTPARSNPYDYVRVPGTVGWPHDHLTVAPTLVLFPHVRMEAITGWWVPKVGFLALRRASLGLSGINSNTFATKSSAPRSKPRIRSSSDARPERTTSGRNGSIRETTPSALRTRANSSRPEPSGSPRSTIARSGRPYSSSRSPSRSPSARTSS